MVTDKQFFLLVEFLVESVTLTLKLLLKTIVFLCEGDHFCTKDFLVLDVLGHVEVQNAGSFCRVFLLKNLDGGLAEFGDLNFQGSFFHFGHDFIK